MVRIQTFFASVIQFMTLGLMIYNPSEVMDEDLGREVALSINSTSPGTIKGSITRPKATRDNDWATAKICVKENKTNQMLSEKNITLIYTLAIPATIPPN